MRCAPDILHQLQIVFLAKRRSILWRLQNATQLHALQVLLYLQPLADPNVDREKQTTLLLSLSMPITVVLLKLFPALWHHLH